MSDSFSYYWVEELCQREPGTLCPEKPDRIRALAPDKIRSHLNDITFMGFSTHDLDILELAHDPAYVQEVERAHASGKRFLDRRDTLATPDVFSQALLSASAGCEAIDAIMEGRLKRAFCAIRPPGHHANALRAMGFCVFNNVAVAARYAQKKHGINRVLIIDWDLDPGNGTQEIFWQDSSVFTLSFHQADLYPAAGGHNLIGIGPGEGFNRNVQLKPGTTGKEYLQIFEHVLCDVSSRFQPELVVIAAGFDAHGCDPQSKLGLHENDFARMTEIVLDITSLSTDSKTLSLLEGGYNISTLQRSVIEHTRVLSTHPSLTPIKSSSV